MRDTDSDVHERAGCCRIVLDGKAGPESAGALLTAARRAVAAAGDVAICCAAIEALDTRSVQILLALQRELLALGRRFRMLDVPEAIARQLAVTGLSPLAAGNTEGADNGGP